MVAKNENRLKIDVKRIKRESMRGLATKIKSLQIQILMVRMGRVLAVFSHGFSVRI